MKACVGLASLLVLSGCGVPTNIEKGPVVLLCGGEEVNHAANGEVVREHKRKFYRLDGVQHKLQTWDDEMQNFTGNADLIVSPNEARYSRDDALFAGVSSRKTIIFDRVLGHVTDEFAMSNGGTITFSAPCKPVKDPTREKKF